MNTRIFNTSLKNETAGLLGISAQLLAAESMPLHFLHKLVVNCAAQAFLKGDWSHKACLLYS